MTDSGLSLPPAKQRPKTQSVGGAARLSPLELPAGQGLACRTGRGGICALLPCRPLWHETDDGSGLSPPPLPPNRWRWSLRGARSSG